MDYLIDSHAHLDIENFDEDRDAVIMRAKENGIEKIVNIATDKKSIYSSLKLAEKYDFVYNVCGIHPHDSNTYNDDLESEIIRIGKHPKTVAIGEIGLDYYYDNSPREIQKTVFRRQIKVADYLDLPMVIHNRDAHKDCLDILKEEKSENQIGVFHCFSGSAEMAKILVKMGFYISFTGVITFKNARKTIEALKSVPIERLMVETDSPFLTPVPNRGKRNEPLNVRYIAKKMAEIKGVEYERFCEMLWENTHNFFSRLPKSPYMLKL